MSDSHASPPNANTRQPNGQFGRGNPGRPVGARGKASQRLVLAILADFEEHQEAVLERLREWHAPTYAAMVSRLLPRAQPVDDAGGEGAEMSPEDVEELMALLQEKMRRAGARAAKEDVIDPSLAPLLAAHAAMHKDGGAP